MTKEQTAEIKMFHSIMEQSTFEMKIDYCDREYQTHILAHHTGRWHRSYDACYYRRKGLVALPYGIAVGELHRMTRLPEAVPLVASAVPSPSVSTPFT